MSAQFDTKEGEEQAYLNWPFGVSGEVVERIAEPDLTSNVAM